MQAALLNKTMDRSDLETENGRAVVESIDALVRVLDSKGLHTTSWYGSLPQDERIRFSRQGIFNLIQRILGRSGKGVGIPNRGPSYSPLPNAADDARIPWYLYWEIYWVMRNGPQVNSKMKVLDAGGTSSLFSCYLASLGCEVHSIDLRDILVSNANEIAQKMGWNMHSYRMNMKQLEFADETFDHAYSICVFEHLDMDTKRQALSEIARCLKPNGILSITFDYRNPAPAVVGVGPDTSQLNQLKTEDDIRRIFLSNERFGLLGNQEFHDNGKSYLVHPKFANAPYTFGAVFLRKKR